MPLLTTALVPAPGRVVVRLTGEMDLSTTGVLAHALTEAAALPVELVVVDVAGARFWDVSSLRVLATFTTVLAAAGRSCRIVGAPAATRRLVVLADFADDLQLDGPSLPPIEECTGAGGLPQPPAPAAVPEPQPASARRGRGLRRLGRLRRPIEVPVGTHGLARTVALRRWA